jgi:hypothetical protein
MVAVSSYPRGSEDRSLCLILHLNVRKHPYQAGKRCMLVSAEPEADFSVGCASRRIGRYLSRPTPTLAFANGSMPAPCRLTLAAANLYSLLQHFVPGKGGRAGKYSLAAPSVRFMQDRGYGVPRTLQCVEKVVVGPVSGPKEARTKAKTLQKRRFQPLNQEHKRARRGFSTRWLPLGSWVNRGTRKN